VDLDGSISLLLFLYFVKSLSRKFFKHSWVDGLELRIFYVGLEGERERGLVGFMSLGLLKFGV